MQAESNGSIVLNAHLRKDKKTQLISRPLQEADIQEDLPENTYLDSDFPEDPTELITENKDFLSCLFESGLDGVKIGEMLKNYHGLSLSDCGKKKTKIFRFMQSGASGDIRHILDF